MVAFTLALAVLFLLLTSFIVRHAIIDCLSFTESLILSIWFCMYSVCSFKYMLANSFCAFFSFRAFALVGFFLLHLESVFTSARLSLTANISDGTLDLVLCFLYIFRCWFSLGVDEILIFVIQRTCLSSLVVHRICFLMLWHIYLLYPCYQEGPIHSVWWVLFGWHSFVGLIVFLPWQFGDQRTHLRKRSKPRNSLHYFPVSCL